MTEKSIEQILDGILVEKTHGKNNLNVEGLTFIHPMHEALIATFQKNIPAGEICQRFATNEKSLREAIATETIMDFLDNYKRAELMKTFLEGANMRELVNKAALQIAEDKRTQDGRVLHQASRLSSRTPIKYLMAAVEGEPLDSVYLDIERTETVQRKAVKLRNTYIRKCILGSALGCLLAVYSFQGLLEKKEMVKSILTRKATLEKTITSLEKKAEEDQTVAEELEKKKELVENYDATAKKKYAEIEEITSKLSLLNQDVSQRESKVSALEQVAEKRNRDLTTVQTSISRLEEKLKVEQESSTKFAEKYFALGCEYHEIGKTDKAIEVFKKTIDLDPRNAKANNALGVVFIGKGEYGTAASYLLKATIFEPQNTDFNQNMGACYALMGDKNRAIAYYGKAMEADPSNKSVQYNLGNLYMTYSENDKALQCFNNYLTLEKNPRAEKIEEVRQKIKKIGESK